MSTDNIFAVINSQRACRAFADTAVPDDLIARVLDAAVYAPSAQNGQPWEFIVVRDPAARATICELMARAWGEHGRTHSESHLSPALFADVDAGLTGGIATAPVLIVVAADTRRGNPRTFGSSIFPCIQNLLLAATALGLGSALTTIANAYSEELSQAIALPDEVSPIAVIPIGFPKRPLGPPSRESFAAHSHRDQYGSLWDAAPSDTTPSDAAPDTPTAQ